MAESLENHEWSDRVKSNGDKIQKRDEHIHGSDVARYLQLVPIRAAKEPKKVTQQGITGRDLLGMTKSKSVMDMGLDDFKRLHRAA